VKKVSDRVVSAQQDFVGDLKEIAGALRTHGKAVQESPDASMSGPNENTFYSLAFRLQEARAL